MSCRVTSQPAEFQNDVLGKGRAELFRDGMKLDQYVDDQGRVFTLKQLAGIDEEQWLDLGELTTKEVVSRAKAMEQEWVSKQSDEVDWASVRNYQEGANEEINEALRSGVLEGHEKFLVEEMDKVFATVTPLEENTVVYRIAYLDDASANSYFGGVAPQAGVEFVDKGYCSTSMSRAFLDRVENWGTLGHETGGGAAYKIRIRVPKGTQALRMPEYYDEAEILLNRSVRFRVIDASEAGTIVTKDGSKIPVFNVEVEVVP